MAPGQRCRSVRWDMLGVSPFNGYELMYEPDFPVLKVGSRMIVPKEKFVEWVSQHTQEGVD